MLIIRPEGLLGARLRIEGRTGMSRQPARRASRRGRRGAGRDAAADVEHLDPEPGDHDVPARDPGAGWNIIGGYTGYISLGHSAFIGVGAYTAGILAGGWDVSPFLVAPLGGVTAALVALLLSLATRRTRGAAFVIVTFAMLELLGVIVEQLESR